MMTNSNTIGDSDRDRPFRALSHKCDIKRSGGTRVYALEKMGYKFGGNM